MTYTYSICHPDKPEIEYPDTILNSSDVLELISNYAWTDILKSMYKIPDDYIHYSPSLDFTSTTDNRSLGITAMMENETPEFSLWYKRPVKVNPLFGILSESIQMKVTDKWDFTLDEALDCYFMFLNGQFEKLEKVMTKK